MSRSGRHLISILFLAGLTLLVYSNTLGNSFVCDDYYHIVENRSIRDIGGNSIIADFTDKDTLASSKDLSANSWRPFATISFALDYRLWKLDPSFYHAENIVLHCLNAALVYAAAFLLFGNILTAFIAAAIFAIHPAQTEAVAWISGRSSLLFLLFFMSSFIFHVRGRMAGRGGINYAASLIFFVCSLFSRETAIILPLILILYDMNFSAVSKARDYIKYYFPFFLTAAFYLLARYSVLGSVAHKYAWAGSSFPGDISVVLEAVAGYIRILVVPVNLRADYLIDIPGSMLEPDTLAAVVILSLIAAAWCIFRGKKNLSFCLGWFFIALIPAYNIIPLRVMMAERFLYLPSVAFAFLAAVLISAGFVRLRDNRWAVGAIALLTAAIFTMYSAAAISRNIDWKDDISLYGKDVLLSPGNPLPHYLLGFACAREARKAVSKEDADVYYRKAIKEFSEAVRLKPDFQAARFELANSYNSTGLYDLAIASFKKAIALGEDGGMYNNLSTAYCRAGRYDEAIAACRRALCIGSSGYYPYVNLGNAYFGKREYGRAKKIWSKAAQLGAPINI